MLPECSDGHLYRVAWGTSRYYREQAAGIRVYDSNSTKQENKKKHKKKRKRTKKKEFPIFLISSVNGIGENDRGTDAWNSLFPHREVPLSIKEI
jgi:hypothetical protein